jgi:hypothetical protein
MFFGF